MGNGEWRTINHSPFAINHFATHHFAIRHSHQHRHARVDRLRQRGVLAGAEDRQRACVGVDGS
jgi:hypothetical protein